MLEVHELTKLFFGLTAVNRVSLKVEADKVTAIIGPNGAGKTTFFNLIAGAHAPSSGTVRLAGRDVTGLRPDQMACLGVARTFQSTNLFNTATVLENLLVGYRLRTRSGLWDSILGTSRLEREELECRKSALEALSFVGLTNLQHQLAGNITQEERKKVALALALTTKPKLLLLDEPAGGINPEESNSLADLIRKLPSYGITVCLIEHKMDMVMRIADKVVVLNHGSKLAEGSPSEIQRNASVIEAYLGADHVEV